MPDDRDVESALKADVSDDGECHFQRGWKTLSGRRWKRVEPSDAELGEILLVRSGGPEKTAFFHSYDGQERKTTAPGYG